MREKSHEVSTQIAYPRCARDFRWHFHVVRAVWYNDVVQSVHVLAHVSFLSNSDSNRVVVSSVYHILRYNQAFCMCKHRKDS